MRFSAPTTWFDHAICSVPDHIISLLLVGQTTCGGWCVSSLLSAVFYSVGRENFERIYRLKTRPHDNHLGLGFDHIFDHKQNRSTRR